MNIPGIGSLPCLFKKAEYATMNFCACITNPNQHHSVNESHSDSLAPARFFQFVPSMYVFVFCMSAARIIPISSSTRNQQLVADS
jgi:hypothetical protein